MAKKGRRPNIPWDAPVIENPKTESEIEVYDAMLSLQYGGTHIRTMLQNLTKKRRGTGPRRFYITDDTFSNLYADLAMDEYSNPTITIGRTDYKYPRVPKRKPKGYVEPEPKVTVSADAFIRFEQEGIFIQSAYLNYDVKYFLTDVIEAYTQYSSNGWYNGGFKRVGNSKTEKPDHTTIGNPITKISDSLCTDKTCEVCTPMRPLIKIMKKYNKDIKTVKPNRSKLPQTIKSFDNGWLLPYNNRPDNHPKRVNRNFDRIKVANAK